METTGTPTKSLPVYQCHKKVWALKIKEILAPTSSDIDAFYQIVPMEDGYAPVDVTRDYFVKHNPEVGGYYVVYENGYHSYSPADVFESGYTIISTQETVSDTAQIK